MLRDDAVGSVTKVERNVFQVRDCVAKDVANINVLKLTDEKGCVLRPKLIGAFQKTRETGSTRTSIIAYAFFQVRCHSSYIEKHCSIVII
jgi:hypothetical protein